MNRLVIVTHGEEAVVSGPLREVLQVCQRRHVEVAAPEAEWWQHREMYLAGHVEMVKDGGDLTGTDLCLVLGGDGTMLRAFHLTQGWDIPVAGVNLGRVGFLTTLLPFQLKAGLNRLLDGEFVVYPLMGLEAVSGDRTFGVLNDIAVGRGEGIHACALGLKINGVTLFEVLCDGVVVATPAGSSAYALAAGGPLLGISVKAYVICLVAPHLVGVRPVVAGPDDVLEITNIDTRQSAYIDIDGRRLGPLGLGDSLIVKAAASGTSLALLEGDSLYHHFRDRLL